MARPPLRGAYELATIPLKEGAVPFTAKAFCMHGERAEAYKKVVQDWLDRGFIERPDTAKPQEWLVQGFVVPKKNAEFPWRGVVDLRGPNEQTRKCNFLLPKIDDLLVKQGKCSCFQSLICVQRFINNRWTPIVVHTRVPIPPGHLPMESERDGSEKCPKPIPTDDG